MGYCGDPAPMMPKAVRSPASPSRKIGYWQSGNVHKRQMVNGQYKCPPVRPGDIPLVHNIPLGGGWTHLYYAFGGIDPDTFKIVDYEDPLYKEFTDLKYKANGPSVSHHTRRHARSVTGLGRVVDHRSRHGSRLEGLISVTQDRHTLHGRRP